MLENIMIPIYIVGGIGLFFALALTIAGRVFEVEVNEDVQRVRDVLPGANCGACGYAGCDLYAQAVAERKAEPNLCTPGGPSTAEKIGEILGLDVDAPDMPVLKTLCCPDTKQVFEYSGIQTCQAAVMNYMGEGTCTYACLGFGDCVAACQYGAIKMQDNIPIIDPELCTRCGLCVKACPKNLIQYLDGDFGYYVACVNKEIGRVTNRSCKNGCIACMLCVKACEYDAIHVIDNVAIIDQEKCTRCGKCYDVCPKDIIKMFCAKH